MAGGMFGSLLAAWRRSVRLSAGSPPVAAELAGSHWLLGRIFVLDVTRRFGLIDAEDGRIVYFHLDAVADAPLEEFVEGAPILFDERRDRLGRRARSVFLISANGAADAIPSPEAHHTGSRSMLASESLPMPPDGETGAADGDRSRSAA